jgi:hypothetical protein
MKSSVTQLERVEGRRAQSSRGARPGGQRAGRPPGRAWLNGREIGGPDLRYAHLGVTHD